MTHRFDTSRITARNDADLFFAHVCDTHITDATSALIVADAVPVLNSLDPDFVAFGGDLTNATAFESCEALRSALFGLRPPAWLLPGNHDIAGGKATFRDQLGPLNWGFDCRGYHVIGLDSTGETDITWGGQFTPETLTWLESHLSGLPAGAPLILFTHHGIHSDQPWAPKANLLWDVQDWEPVHALLRGRNLILACAGHAHENARQQWGDAVMLWSGILSTVRQNHVPLPVGFRLVWIHGGTITAAWVPVL